MFDQYDIRRLEDSRFWLFFCTITSFLFQMSNSFNYVSEQHLQMVKFYWIVFALQFFSLIWAYTRNIHIIYFTQYLYTMRMIWPIFDMENRRGNILDGQWFLFVSMQNTISVINLIIFNNIVDKSAIFFNVTTISLLFYATVLALYPVGQVG